MTPVFLAALLAVPLAGLALLLARPALDVEWEHHPSHFWLVLGVGVINVFLGVLTSEAARRREDERLFVVSLAFLTAAAFLGLHALATPGVILEGSNRGFVIATPVGLLLASGFAAVSSLDLERHGAQLLRRRPAITGGLALLVGGWAVVSLTELPPLDHPLGAEEATTALRILAIPGVALYSVAALRYRRLHGERRAPLLLAVVVAFVLLAEAMVAVALGRNWHASWWEWHVLMALAFGLVAWRMRVEYRRAGSLTSALASLALQRTLDRVDRRYADALVTLSSTLRADDPVAPVLERLRGEGFTGDELALLERSARELRRVDELFRPYVAGPLADRLEQDPGLARLGGADRDVSVLFADLQGFTAFAETRPAAEVLAMLNEYWARVVPIVEAEDGVLERFAGDAILVLFNAAGDQPDHALRAARTGLALQQAAAETAVGRDDWPRFRVGINTGRAIVGNVGSERQRSFTAIGDTTNLAARLQALAEPGQVVISPGTRALLPGAAVEALGAVPLKGKREPVEPFVLRGLGSTRPTEEV